MDMQGCWHLTCCLSWTIGSSSTCANLSLYYRYYFVRCSSELVELVPRPYSQGRSSCYSDRLHFFSVTIPRCYKNVYVSIFFPCRAKLWNSLPIECFPLTYDLSDFKSRINRCLLNVGSSKTDFLYALIFRWGTHLYMSLFLSVHPSVVHHISGTIHHLIIIFGTHM